VKERQILFSSAMVRALLGGRKTQTRRVITPQPDVSDKGNLMGEWLRRPLEGLLLPKLQDIAIHCPHGLIGDRLVVRETFFAYGRWETRYNAKKRRDEWHFVDMTHELDRAYQYAADNPNVPVVSSRHGGVSPAWWKRPAIFMPRTASRITLDITSVRVERLQSISEDDARAEGAYLFPGDGGGWKFDRGEQEYDSAVEAFRRLWDTLNADRGFGWDSNPCVWAVEFRRVTA